MTTTTALLIAFVMLSSVSCAVRRAASFRVLPAAPDYLLRSPDSRNIPFPEVPGEFTSVGPGWVDLRAQIRLRVENAYFREGAPKRGLANFLGTETVRYRVLPTGALEQIAVESRLQRRPVDQPPVQQLLSDSQKRCGHHRLFYQVLLSKASGVRSAVLLSGESADEVDRLARQLLADPESVCGDGSPHCTAFPEACTASLEIDIVVNGASRTVLWTSTLADVAGAHREVKLYRRYQGKLAPVEINPRDGEAFRLPLLPGDVVTER